MGIKTTDEHYRIFAVPGGYAFLVEGKKGLLRSGLPRKSKTVVRKLLKSEFPDAVESSELLPSLVESLSAFYGGEAVSLAAKLDMSGLTDFTVKVYRSLRRVGRGRTVTYKELAEMSGSPGAARGVGAAMRRNPYPPIIPCHRVLGSNGALTGFSSEGGIELKRKMLVAEGLELS